MTGQTYTVEMAWTASAGQSWVAVRGHSGPLKSDAPIPEGAAVRIENGKAVKQ